MPFKREARRIDKLHEIKALGDLPSPKGVALTVMRLSRKEGVSIAELTRAVQGDPALVGRLIKAANAAHNGSRRPVAAVHDALTLLGISTVRYLALSFSLISNHSSGQCAKFNYRRFWSHSLACAVAAHAIALQKRIVAAEEAFSVGLLSRIGELSLATIFPKEYALLLEKTPLDGGGAMLADLEQEAFVMTHAELTAAMFEDWGMPVMFADAANVQDHPEAIGFTPDSREYRVAWMLALARVIADICLAGEAERRGLMPRLLRFGCMLSLEGEALITLCDHVVADWKEWAGQLGIDAHDVPPFEEMSHTPTAPELTADGMPNAEGFAQPLRALIVDDEASMRAVLRALLAGSGYEVFEAVNGQEGFAKALEVQPHILITDWLMAEMDGVELTRALRQTKAGRAIYILILTSIEAEDSLVEAFDAGVDDFMSKPLKPRVLGARLRAGQRVVMLQREIEHDREEIRHFATELAVTNRRLHEAALTDVLTGLPNRRYAIEYFQREWLAANRNKRPLACMMIDVDNFKTINDSRGHDAGDKVLKAVAQAIKRGLRGQDLVSRTGGDEFTVICPETDLPAAVQCAERVRLAIAETRLDLDGFVFNGSASIGVAARDAQMANIDALIKRADEGVYVAKQRGRNCVMTVQRSAAPQ